MDKILNPEDFIKNSVFKTLELMLENSPDDFEKVLELEKNPQVKLDEDTMKKFNAMGLIDPTGGLHFLVQNSLESLRRVNFKVPKRGE